MEYISQKAIGKSSRSNPVTYIKAYDDIRKLFLHKEKVKFEVTNQNIFHSMLTEADAKLAKAKEQSQSKCNLCQMLI